MPLVIDGITLLPGDCLEVLKTLEANSVDACVCDPPYGLGREPDPLVMLRAWLDGGHYNVRSSSGFMGKEWDSFVPQPAIWKHVFRVLKPGAHLLAFFGTRTYDLGTLAIRLAGFECRDMCLYLYGAGFPKSLNVSVAIDKAAGAKREVIGTRRIAINRWTDEGRRRLANGECGSYDLAVECTATDAAREWNGWGTALKPACEPIVLARKPLSESTVAANVLKWGTGALNIDGCRVGKGDDRTSGGLDGKKTDATLAISGSWSGERFERPTGARWPANVIHDGSDEVVGAFPETISGGAPTPGNRVGNVYGVFADRSTTNHGANEGSAARFFYTAKADSDDRLGSKHPTVKPLDLMQYLVRLVCPPKGCVIDPFAGTGTTGEAAFREGMRAILIEREAEYQEDIRRRLRLAVCGPAERERESIKARMKDKPVDAGPLFGGLSEAMGGGMKYAKGRSKCKYFVALDPIAPSNRSD